MTAETALRGCWSPRGIQSPVPGWSERSAWTSGRAGGIRGRGTALAASSVTPKSADLLGGGSGRPVWFWRSGVVHEPRHEGPQCGAGVQASRLRGDGELVPQIVVGPEGPVRCPRLIGHPIMVAGVCTKPSLRTCGAHVPSLTWCMYTKSPEEA